MKWLLLFVCFSFYGQSTRNFYVLKKIDADGAQKLVTPTMSVFDKHGYLWIGTQMGLYRYDGKYLKKIIPKSASEIATQRIVQLCIHPTDNSIYFSTSPSNRLYKINSNKEDVTEIKKGNVLYLLDSKNSIYSTEDTELSELILNSLQLNKERVVFNHNYISVFSLFQTEQYLYIQYDKGFNIIDYKNKCLIGSYIFTNINLFHSFTKDSLLLNVEKNLISLQGNKISINQVYFNHSFKKLFNELSLRDKKYFYTSNRVFIRDFFVANGKVYKIVYHNHFLSLQYLFDSPASDIVDVNYNIELNLYVVTSVSNGIFIMRENDFITLQMKSSHYDISYCIKDIKESIYSSKGWFYDFSKKKYTYDGFPSYYRNSYLILPYEDSNFVQASDVLYDISSKKTSFKISVFDEQVSCNSYCEIDGNLMVGLFNNKQTYLGYLKDKKIQVDNYLTGFFKEREINFLEYNSNIVFIGTTQGVFTYDTQTKKIAEIELLKGSNCRHIKKIEDIYWFCTYGHGLYFMKNGIYKKVKVSKREDEAFHSIEDDGRGNFWLSTNDGLLYIDKKYLYSRIANDLDVSFYNFTVEEGLLGNEFNGGSTHPSMQFKNRYLCFPSMKGVVVFDPKQTNTQAFNSVIQVDKVYSGNKEIKSDGDSYAVTSDIDLVKLSLSYPYFYNRENLKFEYKFHEEKWKEVENNEIYLLRPTNGNYELRIRITTLGVNQTPIEKRLSFEFEPKFTETTLFKLGVLGVFIVLIYFSYLAGKRISRLNEIRLEEKIALKTVELNIAIKELSKSKEEINQSLIVKELLLKEIHHRVKNNLQLILSLINLQSRRTQFKNVDDFLSNCYSRIMAMVLIHQHIYQNDDIEHLYVTDYVDSLLESLFKAYKTSKNDIELILEIERQELSLDFSIPFGLIVSEIVTNFLKYSLPKSEKSLLYLKFSKYEGNFYILEYKDNGPGFKQNNYSEKSIGIELIHLMVSQLQGEIELHTIEFTHYIIKFNISKLK